jgi:hypothetical protein
MATILNPKLEIFPNLEQRIARVTVSLELHFTDQELKIMRSSPNHIFFQLTCHLYGKDLDRLPYLNEDDWIYTYPTEYFPDRTPEKVENVRLESVLGLNLLNEDVIGTDELYAQLILRGRMRFKDTVAITQTDVVRF